MAGEGLFFTGVVLKNNRDLIQEEAVREQLRLRREELDLQKQSIADERAEARRERQKPGSYSLESIDSRFIPKFSENVGSYKNSVAENPDDEVLRSKNETSLGNDQQILKNITSDYQNLVELSKEGKDKKFYRDSEGGYMYEYNMNEIVKGYNNGEDLVQLLNKFPLNYDDISDVTEFKNPVGAKTSDFIENQKAVEEIDGVQYPFSKGVQEKTRNFIIQNSTPNPDGSFDDPNFEMMMVKGQNIDFLNSGPADPRFMFGMSKGYSDVGKSFYNKINPKSGEGVFDPNLYKEFQEFVVDEMIKLEKSKNPPIRVFKKTTGEGGAQEGLSQEDINFLSGPSKSTLSYGNVQLKFDAGMYDDVTDRNIEVNIVPESLLPGQGELQEFFEKQYKDEVGDTNKSVKGQVTRLGLTADNVKVASVKFGKKEYLIPYESISSEIAELKKTSVGYKIGQFEFESTPQGIDTSKYNK